MNVALRPRLTICGIDELPGHSEAGVSHVLSLLDPDRGELAAFDAYGPHRRTVLWFHDIIDARPGMTMPREEHVADVIAFGEGLRAEAADGHILVHCHMGVSRSTAAMLTLMAQAAPEEDADALFLRLKAIRSQAWPNSVMIGFADAQLGRGGALTAALGRHYARQIKDDPRFIDWMRQLGRHAELEMGGTRG